MMSDFIELSKPRMVIVFLIVGLASFFIEGGKSPAKVASLIIVGLLAPSSTNIITSAIDRNVDVQMQRTQKRPVPDGRVEGKKALFVGLSLALFSLAVSFVFLGVLAAFLVLAAIFGVAVLYNLVLKTRTPFSTLIGAVPGSFPVLVGGATASKELTMDILFLAGVLFLWQLPHFWIISLRHKKDYHKARIPSIASTFGDGIARRLILASCIILFLYTIILSSKFGSLYLASSILAGAVVIWASIDIWRGNSPKSNHVMAYIFFIIAVFISAAV